ncbi:MAG TPA: lipoate--protein ligase family protein [Candidatus Izemoplasmatales bacterium]|nr:lipoate--protein ligase family protein [Candidatus Izemoplasmatales bacterium]
MGIIIGKNKSVAYHLATEEYLLRHYALTEDILYLWFGSKAFVFGRNQNPYIEIAPKYLLNPDIPKLRRVSGGGTIYQDEGTLNFSFITSDYKSKINDYQYFLSPIINYLKQKDLNVYFQPKSHLFVGNQKISGNAQAFINNRLMHHGTLLYDTDLSVINEALVDFDQQVDGHQVLSNKQAVRNLKEDITLIPDMFLKDLMNHIINKTEIGSRLISDLDDEKIKDIMKRKYHQWDWNFGHTPKFTIDVRIKGDDVQLTIEKGLITKTKPKKHEYLIGEKFYSEHYLMKI